MQNRKSRYYKQTPPGGASTPSTPIDNLNNKRAEAKRQFMKKQRLRQRERRQAARQQSKSSNKHTLMLIIAAKKVKRERWSTIAAETLDIVLGDGKYVEERRVPLLSSTLAQSARQGSFDVFTTTTHVAHDVAAQIELSRQGTIFYPHYSEPLAKWAHAHPITSTTTTIDFSRNSTLTVARRLSQSLPPSGPQTKLGVLSFASPKKPGGGFLHGGDEQEETIARLSSLVASLGVPAAKDFYKEHKKYKVEDGSGLHDHSMVCSPGVVVIRRDWDDDTEGRPSEDSTGGDFIAPYLINVLSVVPVNAAAVRAKHLILPSEEQFFEDGIRSAMKERMARALRVFEERGDKVLVLGAFGCGSSQNKVEMVASVWAELLVCGRSEDGGEEAAKRAARFKNSFEKVVFAVPGKLFELFKSAFEMRIFEEQVALATMDE
ncbi:hypothetical protein A0H81_10495 [Grifola frondosa]|uniref:Microbial-type PARG catalytic domain-containing protein n=1 Tax=Grifola frondosa TaxID=5627 RepID=A0A1C7LXU5_GRIFR|nr:hypothetical protein A0H81_10495 [Grifola frondosa]